MIVTPSETSTSPMVSPKAGPSSMPADVEPPAYAPAASSSSNSAPRVNHLYIKERDKSVKGSWTIDTSMKIPPALLPAVEEEGELDNLHLKSRYDNVEAHMYLASRETPPRRAMLHLESGHGSVKAHVYSRQGSQPFKLKATTEHAQLLVRIPRDFNGPLIYKKSSHNKITFSQGVRDHLVIFNQMEGEGKAFIGDWSASGYDGERKWEGDELEMSSTYGWMRVYYCDEPVPLTQDEILRKEFVENGLVCGMFRWLKGLPATIGQEIAAQSSDATPLPHAGPTMQTTRPSPNSDRKDL